MAYYTRHLFFCLNQRDDGSPCCTDHDAEALFDHAKRAAKKLGLQGGRDECRVNRAGCLNRCSEGPVCVIYPEGIWYTFVNTEDIDEIVNEHLQHGRIVERLRLK